MNSERKNVKRYAGPLVVYSAVFLVLLSIFIGWQVATVRVFIVNEGQVGVFERKSWLGVSREVVPPGRYKERKSTAFYAVPTGTQRVDFQVRVVKGMLQRPADYIRSWGFRKSNPLMRLANQVTVEPVFVRGQLEISLTEKQIGMLVDEADGVDFASAFLPALKSSVMVAFEHRDEPEKFREALLTEASNELKDSYRIEVSDVVLQEVRKLSGDEAEMWDLNMATVKVVEPASVSEMVPELFWQAFLFTLVFVSCITVLFFVFPEALLAFAALFAFWD